MTRHYIYILCLLLMGVSAQAQFKIGFKGGVSTYDVGTDSIRILEPGGANAYWLVVQEANYGIHFGLVSQINIRGFIIQPEIVYNTNRVDFRVTDKLNVSNIVTERYQYLDIPILIGAKAGPLRLNFGPVGHVFLQNTSGLVDFEGYREDFKSMTLGFQAGLGIDFWKILLDVRYEGNLSNFGDHITFFGNKYQFSDTPRRLLASISLVF